MKNTWLAWFLATIITLLSAFYQRVTGPTHPLIIEFTHNGKLYSEKLIRTFGGYADASVYLKNCNEFTAQLYYRHYPILKDEAYTKIDFTQQNGKLVAMLPNQPPAGKLQYYITISDKNIPLYNNNAYPVLIRFKGEVPGTVLFFHVILIFLAMFFANLAGIMAIFKNTLFRKFTFVSLALISIGGMIFGPIVQKYAFGEFWTGIPKGYDLTDNKTLIAFIAWIVAALLNFKKPNRRSTILAATITIIIFSIPHSLFGSTLNRETGEVVQGILFMTVIYQYRFNKKKEANESRLYK